MASLEVKIVSRENIKPASPTPHHLKTFNLSAFDQLTYAQSYPSVLLFYPLRHQNPSLYDLKSSLSETLVHFYPLAGRIIHKKPFTDCNDAGAEFIEAKVSGRLDDYVKHPDQTLLSELLPTKGTVSDENAAAGRILLVQATVFGCGGIAIGVSASHRIADASTINMFIKGWAARTRGAGDVLAPDMTIASRFPWVQHPADDLLDSLSKATIAQPCKTRRFVFDSKSINALKAKATSATGVQRPSRVQVVFGHILLHMTKLNVKKRSHVMIQSIDLRKRVDPPIPHNSMGNCVGFSATHAFEDNEKEIDLEGLVSKLTTSLQNAMTHYAEKLAGPETSLAILEIVIEMVTSVMMRDGVDYVMASSWCKFGLYENGDFGWGKPSWVSLVDAGKKNTVTLMDTKDGEGVEALVTLEDHDMDLFETNLDFLEFTSLNPNVDLH